MVAHTVTWKSNCCGDGALKLLIGAIVANMFAGFYMWPFANRKHPCQKSLPVVPLLTVNRMVEFVV